MEFQLSVINSVLNYTELWTELTGNLAGVGQSDLRVFLVLAQILSLSSRRENRQNSEDSARTGRDLDQGH